MHVYTLACLHMPVGRVCRVEKCDSHRTGMPHTADDCKCVLQCIAACCSVLQRVALCCSVLHCVDAADDCNREVVLEDKTSPYVSPISEVLPLILPLPQPVSVSMSVPVLM